MEDDEYERDKTLCDPEYSLCDSRTSGYKSRGSMETGGGHRHFGKNLALFGTIPAAFGNPLPSMHPVDLCVGLVCGAVLRTAVYLRGKNAKKYRHNVEYGSARWGTAKDIEPFIAPKFEDNVILTKTERLMMSNRPKNPKYARNKNVLIVGGSGSGKTRFWLKPNLLQMHSSYVVTDPKGSIAVECGNAAFEEWVSDQDCEYDQF